MKITLNTLRDWLIGLMRRVGVKTKRAALILARDDYNRRQRMASMTKYLGTFDKFMTLAELNESRSAQ